MSREIKFRAWDGDEFWYFDLLDLLGSDDTDYQKLQDLLERNRVDRLAPFKGKYGVEIYEGDILAVVGESLEFEDINPEPHNRIVIFLNGCFTTTEAPDNDDWYSLSSLLFHAKCEIIGNTYQNADLLEEAP